MGGGGRKGTGMGVWQRPFLEAVLPKRHVRNVLYSKFCSGKRNGAEHPEIGLLSGLSNGGV